MSNPVHGIVASNHQRRRGDLQIAPTNTENATHHLKNVPTKRSNGLCFDMQNHFSKWINVIWYYLLGFM
jgi:hypothetical protein